MKTLAVIGATGGVGGHVVRQALAKDWIVHALARQPDQVMTHHARLRVFGIDARDPETLRPPLAGTDFVISCLGNRPGESPVVAEGTRNTLSAMEALAVPRLALISSLGVGDSAAQLRQIGPAGWLFALVFNTLLGRVKRDLTAAEAAAEASPVTTIVVRPAGLTDEPETGQWHATHAAGRLGRTIPRGDLAAFLVHLVDDDRFDGQAVSVSR